MERIPPDSGFVFGDEGGVDGGERLLDELGRAVAGGAGVAVERHAHEDVFWAELAADGGERVDGVGEVVADAAEPVVERGRAVDGNGDDEAGFDGGAERADGLGDALGGDAVGGKMDEQQIGAGGGEGLDDGDEIRPVGGFAAGEVDPLEKRIGGGDGADFVEGQFVVEAAGRVFDFPNVAVNAARVAAFGDDEDEFGRRRLDAGGGGGGARGEAAPGVERAHLAGAAGAGAGSGGTSARKRATSVSRSESRTGPPGAGPPKRAMASGVSMR